MLRYFKMVMALPAFTACIKVPTIAESDISFSTQPIDFPSEKPCLYPTKKTNTKELMMGKSLTVLQAAGENTISETEWEDFKPGFHNAKNPRRHPLFESSCLTRSPGTAADCTDSGCLKVMDVGGWTWLEQAKIEAIDCMPNSRYCDPTYVPVLHLLAVTLTKCQELHFSGQAFVLYGPSGEEAIMHGTADGRPTTDVALPKGWSLEKRQLPEPLTLRPFGAGDECYHTILRDHRGQSYHMYSYAKATGPSLPLE
jgi:hypothetical protein